MATYRAYCYASGQIGFGQRLPKGALPIICGDNPDQLKADIAATARRAYDGKTYLVPGVPEAVDQWKGLDALQAYTKWLNERREKRVVA